MASGSVRPRSPGAALPVAAASFLAAAVLAAALCATAPLAAQESAPRIVTLGGSVTETVFALGLGDRVVAVDASSSVPAEVEGLPQVGYYRTLSAEGLLALQPDLVIGPAAAGPAPVLDLVRRAGVRVALVDDAHEVADIPRYVAGIAEALGVPERGARLAETVRADLARVAALRAASTGELSALFVWNRDGPGLQVAGSGTGAHTMLEAAGLRNAGAALEGYQPFNAEALLLADPDVLIVPTTTAEGLGGLEALLSLPSVAATTAARTGNVVVVDLLAFIGFGPRAGQALAEVMEQARATAPWPSASLSPSASPSPSPAAVPSRDVRGGRLPRR